jgi:hypothetical protein
MRSFVYDITTLDAIVSVPADREYSFSIIGNPNKPRGMTP